MGTPTLFVDPEFSTQVDGAQSSRVPVPLPEAIRQAYLVGTDTKSEPFEDPVETEAPKSPYTVAPPTSLPDCTPPTLVSILRRTARIVVRVLPAMSRAHLPCSPSSSPPDLPSRKRYQGTSELVEDDEEEEDDEEGDDVEEDEKMEECSDSDSVSEDTEDEGGDESVPEGQPRAAAVVETAVGEPLGLGYEALRHQEIALEEGRMPSVFEVDIEDGIVYIDVPAYPPLAPPAQTPPSPEWSSGSLPIFPSPSIVPSPISSPMIPLTVPSPAASPAMTETKGFLTELEARVKIQEGLIHDHTVRLEELSPALSEMYDRDIGVLFTRSGAV
ncbi:hypothetical protein Tco_0876753 [Tanacetum coccineum]|uniref:Uncharacterized protein n=1 Tax=Tanacetum coccineum TaxID=301880 RepID=A0ABQ5BW40_9ASTR